ncbi:MAG: transglycosylase SLT domain-containing protein [Armatimonadota bacterium]|nr:transglycosylase SLT domain-containing protein [Armatimonadota bacterium]MDR7404559.1 transglycosylase SLT domain-containing protein [Armatimonadota bacterium]
MTRTSWLACAGAIVAAVSCAAGRASGGVVLPPRELLPAVVARAGGRCADASDLLRRLRWHPGPAGYRARYLLGHCALAAGEAAAAGAEFDAVAAGHPPLADYARWYSASAALLSGDLAGAADRLVSLAVSSGNGLLARRARLQAAEVLLQLDRPDAALRMLSPFRPEDSGPEMVRVWWLRGRAAEAMGRRADAVRAYAMAGWSDPEGGPEADAARAWLHLRGLGDEALPVEARLTRARRLIALGEFEAARRELVAALHRGVTGIQAADAWFRLGLLRLPGEDAVYAFGQSARIADPGVRARGLYWMGRALAARGRRGEARAVWVRVLRELGATPWAPRAMASLASSAEAAGDLAQARRWWTELARRYPTSSVADDARWRLGWLAFRQHRYGEAERLFRAYADHLDGAPRAAAGLFWAAKARQAAGMRADALWRTVADRYPLTYYGQRARLMLGRPSPSPPPGAAPVRLADDQPSSAYQELAALGFVDDALEAVRARRAGTALSPSQARELAAAEAWLASVAGDAKGALEAASSLVPAALAGGPAADRDVWEAAYPRAFWEEVQAAARRHRVDPYLVLAVMREESRFDPRAVSPARAVGLMQIIPATAEATAGRPVDLRQLMDPAVNIDLGAAYVGAMVRRFGGDLILALAAYNAGPAAAGRWSRGPRNDPDVFVESIPYAETRAYVQRVMQTYGIYRWLYP